MGNILLGCRKGGGMHFVELVETMVATIPHFLYKEIIIHTLK
jgi:hypothetical protein